MSAPTELERFWEQVQLDLAGLPRPDSTLQVLRCVDPQTYQRLVEGERWLLWQTDIGKLRIGWRQWLQLYRTAIKLLVEAAAERSASTCTDLAPDAGEGCGWATHGNA